MKENILYCLLLNTIQFVIVIVARTFWNELEA